MKRIAAFFFAFFAVCYLQIADADAQFRRECRAGFCVPSGGPSGTPISNACTSTPGTTITFTAQGTGSVNPSRISVVSINWSSAGSSEITAVTIGGISMTRAIRATAALLGNNSEIWFVANPTGTSANIVITASVALTGATIEVYSLIGYTSVVAATFGTTSVSQTFTNKQLAIAAGSRGTNVSTSLSNMTNDFSSACGLTLWGVHASKSLKASGTLTSAISPTSSNPEIALAVWGVSSPGTCAESVAFFGRTSGLDSQHTIAYNNLICGLVTDGVWTKLDMLHVYATQDSTTSLLNLIGNIFNGTNAGAVFTADRGWKGLTDGSDHIVTGFNPSTASSPKYVQNSAHMSIWGVANDGSQFNQYLGGNGSNGTRSEFYPWYQGDTKTYFRINDGASAGIANVATTAGHWITNRSSSVQITGYRNGVSVQSLGAETSTAVANIIFDTLAVNDNGTHRGNGTQAGMASFGSSLSGTDVTNFYNRLRTYMTAVGAP